MTVLWTGSEAAEATGGRAQGRWQAERVVIDSRQVRQGDLFVAIRGEHFDGHQFVGEALAGGAVGAVVSHVPPGLGEDAPLLLVDDTLKALQGLGRAGRRRSRAKVIGVTGSVGKTSAKEMLRMALSAHGTVYATAGNLNNHIGTPLNLANLPPDAAFAVFEMGMNHAGEIALLTAMVQPHVAAITTIEAVHIEFFESLDAIAAAKSEIFEGMGDSGIAVLNRDIPQFALMQAAAARQGITRTVTFGGHADAHCRLVEYAASADGCNVTASVEGRPLAYRMGATGRHWAMLSLLVLAVAHALGLDDAKTAGALSSFAELEGRGRALPLPLDGGEAVLIDDSYNASPAAMRAAFAKTSEIWERSGRKGRRLAALGNMLELGGESPQLHAGLAEELVAQGFDAVYTAGDLMRHLHEALPEKLRAAHVAQAMQLLPLLRQSLRAGDIILVKGSHGSKMYELAKALRDSVMPKEAA